MVEEKNNISDNVNVEQKSIKLSLDNTSFYDVDAYEKINEDDGDE